MALTKRTEVSAILGEEFFELIDLLGVREDFDNGRCSCDNCHVAVDSTNVLLVFPEGGNKVAFLCANPPCVAKYNESL